MSDTENNRYIKTGHESGYVPVHYVVDDENEYIITPLNEWEGSSGEVKNFQRRIIGSRRLKK